MFGLTRLQILSFILFGATYRKIGGIWQFRLNKSSRTKCKLPSPIWGLSAKERKLFRDRRDSKVRGAKTRLAKAELEGREIPTPPRNLRYMAAQLARYGDKEFPLVYLDKGADEQIALNSLKFLALIGDIQASDYSGVKEFNRPIVVETIPEEAPKSPPFKGIFCKPGEFLDD